MGDFDLFASGGGGLVHAAFFDKDSGQIVLRLTGTMEQFEHQRARTGLPFVVLESLPSDIHNGYWVVGGELVARPELDVSLSGGVLHGVPEGAEVYIGRSLYRAEGGPILLDADPGSEHVVRIVKWPFKDLEVVYAANQS